MGSRLVVERLPAYAPELNPTEGLWSSLNAVELANLTGPTLAEVIQQAQRGVERVRRTPHLAYRYQDLGHGFYDTRSNAERRKRNHVRQLEALGYKVTLQPAA